MALSTVFPLKVEIGIRTVAEKIIQGFPFYPRLGRGIIPAVQKAITFIAKEKGITQKAAGTLLGRGILQIAQKYGITNQQLIRTLGLTLARRLDILRLAAPATAIPGIGQAVAAFIILPSLSILRQRHLSLLTRASSHSRWTS